jgi:hypothetical protein
MSTCFIKYIAEKHKEAHLVLMDGRANGHLTLDVTTIPHMTIVDSTASVSLSLTMAR